MVERYRIAPALFPNWVDRAHGLLQQVPRWRHSLELVYSPERGIFTYFFATQKNGPRLERLHRGAFEGIIRKLRDPRLPVGVDEVAYSLEARPISMLNTSLSRSIYEETISALGANPPPTVLQVIYEPKGILKPDPKLLEKQGVPRSVARKIAGTKTFKFEVRAVSADLVTIEALEDMILHTGRFVVRKRSGAGAQEVLRKINELRWSWRFPLWKKHHLWSSNHLVTLVHIPNANPLLGRVDVAPMSQWNIRRGFVIGYLDPMDRAEELKIVLPVHEGHTIVLGKTGMGKSTLLLNMAIQAAYDPEGALFLIDPHGNLATSLAMALGEEFRDRIVYIAPHRVPVGLNLLHAESEEAKTLLVSDVKAALARVATTILKRDTGSWGTRIDYIMTNLLRALVEVPGSNLVDAMRILEDRDGKVSRALAEYLRENGLGDDLLISFLEESLPSLKSDERRSSINRLSPLVSNPVVRRSVCHRSRTVNIDDVVRGKIVIAELPKSRLGEDIVAVIGSVLISNVWSALLRHRPSRRVYIFVDEFHNFDIPTFHSLLSEGRKFGARLVMATQFTKQIAAKTLDSIRGNCINFVAFASDEKTANDLKGELKLREAAAAYLSSLPKYSAIASSIGPNVTKVYTPPPPELVADESFVDELARRFSIAEDDSLEYPEWMTRVRGALPREITEVLR